MLPHQCFHVATFRPTQNGHRDIEEAIIDHGDHGIADLASVDAGGLLSRLIGHFWPPPPDDVRTQVLLACRHNVTLTHGQVK